MNSPERAAVRGIELPRRPYLIALSLTMLVAAVQWTPRFGPLADRQARSLVVPRHAATPFRVPAKVDSAALDFKPEDN